MKVENEDLLDDLIICKECSTLHQEIKIEEGLSAYCRECGSLLYHHNRKLVDVNLALSMTGLIFFILANSFPLIQIELLGHEQFISLPKTFIALWNAGFYLVGILCAFLIFIFPLMIFMINIILFGLLKAEKSEKMTKELLILLAYIKPWSMSDIFFISILVSLVKLIGYAQIDLGISFWALIVFIVLDIYVSKKISLSQIWLIRKKIFFKSDTIG